MFRRFVTMLSILLLNYSVCAAFPAFAAAPVSGPWPHHYTIDGASLTFYQPQLDSLEGRVKTAPGKASKITLIDFKANTISIEEIMVIIFRGTLGESGDLGSYTG